MKKHLYYIFFVLGILSIVFAIAELFFGDFLLTPVGILGSFVFLFVAQKIKQEEIKKIKNKYITPIANPPKTIIKILYKIVGTILILFVGNMVHLFVSKVIGIGLISVFIIGGTVALSIWFIFSKKLAYLKFSEK